jgi:adiponectin receptor
MVHSCILSGIAAVDLFPLKHVVGMELFYLLGAVLYVSRFPERMFPDKFDIWV